MEIYIEQKILEKSTKIDFIGTNIDFLLTFSRKESYTYNLIQKVDIRCNLSFAKIDIHSDKIDFWYFFLR